MPETIRAEYRGELAIGEIVIPCFVLEDGTRVITGRGLTAAIGMKGRGQGATRIAEHRVLKPYLSDELVEHLTVPIRFTGSTSRSSMPTTGYEATVLHSVCEAILRAGEEGILRTPQEERYYAYCLTLIRAFARVGIIALVDEATGYQEVRERDELHRILEKFVRKELLPWAKMFPDEFYDEIYRLRGWKKTPGSAKRPSYVGKLTNTLVYDKMPPHVLTALQEKNPTIAPGRRRYKHHQFLTEDMGHPHLKTHLIQVITLMKASNNWAEFDRLFKRAFADSVGQAELDLDIRS